MAIQDREENTENWEWDGQHKKVVANINVEKADSVLRAALQPIRKSEIKGRVAQFKWKMRSDIVHIQSIKISSKTI